MFCRILALFSLVVLSYGNSLLAQTISYSTLFDNSSFSRSIDLSKPVGAIAGAAGTSPSGAATYTIPISCPPGTNGLVPQIALVYNSQSGNGILGQGWSLSGLSAITRAGKDFYHDGKAAPASYTNDDAFVLDGQRLVPQSGSNGAPGTIYSTEAESYAAITSFESIGEGPRYFNIVSKDGTIMQYGYTDDARFMNDGDTRIMMWRLNKIQDIHGNYISFHYDNSGRDSRLVKIAYTGNMDAGLNPYNEINFQYAIRSDENKVYDAGSSFNSKYLLWQIQVKEKDADIFKTWQFSYGKNNAGASYLKLVEEFASDNSKLNDTRFKYGEATPDMEVKSSNINIPYRKPLTDYSNPDIISGDFDGDGKSEMLVAQYDLVDVDFYDQIFNKHYKSFAIYKQSSSTSSDLYVPLTGASDSWSAEGKHLISFKQSNSSKSFVVSDFDGDGKDDLFFFRNTNLSGYPPISKMEGTTIYYSRVNSSGFYFDKIDYSPATLSMPYGGQPHLLPGKNKVVLGDFDGDKRTDYLYFTQSSEYYGGTTQYTDHSFVSFPGKGEMNNRLMQTGTPSWDDGVFTRGFMNNDVYVLDFDGDGISELMTIETSKSHIFKVLKSASGHYFFQHVVELGYPRGDHHDIYGIGDFNADGKDDLITRVKSTNDWEIGFSDGKLLLGYRFDLNPTYMFQNMCGAYPADRLYIGDYNGDGKSDLLHESCDCGNYRTKSTFNVYYFNGIGGDNKMKYITKSYAYANKAMTNSVTEIRPIITDLNGDGKNEISFKTEYDNEMQTLYLNKDSKSHLLEKVTDGFNRTTEFIYDPLTKGGDIYTKGSGETYPVNNAQYPVYVVTSLKAPDGVGGISTTALRYENLRLHRAGRGLLGFEKIRSINFTTGIETQTQYALNRDFYVPYLERTKSFPSIDPSKYTQVIDSHLFTRIGSGYCYKQTNPSGSSENQLTGSTGSYSNTYDAHGNITYSSSSALIGGGETMLTNVTNTMMITGGSPVPNRPQYVVTETKRGSKPTVSVQEYFEYDSKGRVSRHQVRKLPLTTTGTFITDYTYNWAGNVTKKQELTSTGDAPTYWPVTQYLYDSKGRFAEKMINTLGDTTSKTWHKFWGAPLTETGLDGLVRSSTYNAWGKLMARTIPVTPLSAYTVTYSDAWDISGTQLYYTLSTDPSAPDTKTWYDIAGRPLRTMSEGFSGWTTAVQSYNNKGQLVSSTNNYLPSETPRTSVNTYDALNRLSSVTDFSGTSNYSYSYSGGATTVTLTGPSGIQKKTETDALGKVLRSTADTISGTVHYTYDSRGNETETRVGTWSGTIQMGLIRKEYDPSGRLTRMIDPDAGTSTYEYDAFGRMLRQTDALGKVTQCTYDQLGRLVLKELDGYKTTYEFWDKTKAYALKKQDLEYPTGLIHITDEYEYGVGGGLVTKHTRTGMGHLFEKKFTYTAYGQPSSTEYVNSGFKKQHHYDNNGYLLRIKTLMAGGGTGERTLYEATAMNGDGQLKSWKRADGLPATIAYNNGFVAGLSTGSIQNLAMSYDYARGNVWGRADLIAGTTEEFNYDAANRLIYARAEKLPVGGSPGMAHMPLTMEYENNVWGSYGRIKSKSDVGTYKYPGFPRNAIATLQDPANLVSHATQDIVYRPFHKAGIITETVGGVPFREVLDYDANHSRVRSERSEGGTPTLRRWYFGDFELTENLATGSVQSLHYISGDAGLCGIVKEEGGSLNYYSVYTDHLGSVVTVTDEAADVVARQSYDPWGRERNPEDWGYGMPILGPAKPSWLYRGYTGHEMLPEYGLINMNGRLYDPLNGRMLRPDNYVQDPANSQSYNRYSYCWNNPMTYTDPSGDIVWALPYLTINKRGINFGVSGGVGVPGALSAQANVSYGTSNNFSASVGVTALGTVSGNVGWGTNSGFFANAGIGVGLGMPGFTTNMTSAGVGWSQRGGVYAYGAGITVSQGGDVDFNPSIGYAYGFTNSRRAIPGGPSTADIRHDADGYLTSETTEIIGHINHSSNGPWEYANNIMSYGTFIPASASSFIQETKAGRWAAMGGFRYSGATFSQQKAMISLSNQSSKVIGGAGKILGAAGLVLTAADMYQNGVNTSNAIDMAMGAASFIPIYGWVIGGVYFIGNEALKYSTGRDIGQHIDSFVK